VFIQEICVLSAVASLQGISVALHFQGQFWQLIMTSYMGGGGVEFSVIGT